MAHVILIGNLQQFTDGVVECDLDVTNAREFLARFGVKVPALQQGLAVVIDGQIHQDAPLAGLGVDREVHILPQLAGG